MKRTGRFLSLLLCAACASPRAGIPARDQRTYPTAEEAVAALEQATASRDREELKRIFGPKVEDYLSGDAVQDKRDFQVFHDMLAQAHRLEERQAGGYFLCIGRKDWPFAVPLVQSDRGWFFDAVAGEEELLDRRIGRNELKTIDTCHAYVHAQVDYAKKDRDGDKIREYAQQVRSDAGKRNGLYWEATGGEVSPLGPLVDEARAAGYSASGDPGPRPYYGYLYRILKAQGPNAPGGAKDYVVKGNMTQGFALVATPVTYGKSGIASFLIGSDGKLYQKDLGPNPPEISLYDPDASWQPCP